MPELINVCHAVRCPYSKKSGCDRYTVSPHCHLAYEGPGKVRQGFHTMASQYWLYADDSFNLPETQQIQDDFLAEPDEICRAERTVMLQDKPYEVSWNG